MILHNPQNSAVCILTRPTCSNACAANASVGSMLSTSLSRSEPPGPPACSRSARRKRRAAMWCRRQRVSQSPWSPPRPGSSPAGRPSAGPRARGHPPRLPAGQHCSATAGNVCNKMNCDAQQPGIWSQGCADWTGGILSVTGSRGAPVRGPPGWRAACRPRGPFLGTAARPSAWRMSRRQCPAQSHALLPPGRCRTAAASMSASTCRCLHMSITMRINI